MMVLPIPNWLEIVILVMMAMSSIVFLGMLGFVLSAIWDKLFNYLGRNEIREVDAICDESKSQILWKSADFYRSSNEQEATELTEYEN